MKGYQLECKGHEESLSDCKINLKPKATPNQETNTGKPKTTPEVAAKPEDYIHHCEVVQVTCSTIVTLLNN